MLDTEVIAILHYLLPGFLAASIYYAFTSHQRPNTFERVVQALVFTLVVEAILTAAAALGAPSTAMDSVTASVGVALLLGVTLAITVNHDLIHKLSRKLRVTRETSYPTEWYSAFAEFSNGYLVLHLVGERRLYGWAWEWPSSPKGGHFIIVEGEWLTGDGRQNAGDALVISTEDVEMVEFAASTSGQGH